MKAVQPSSTRLLPLLALGLLLGATVPTCSFGATPAEAEAAVAGDRGVEGTELAPDLPAYRLPGPLPEGEIPDAATLEAMGAVIGSIHIIEGDIFDMEDPKERYKLYRLANRLHRKTRERVIEAYLLFAPGDPYKRYAVEESERILRNQRYLFDAEIRAVRFHDNQVDLVILTRDVWTLTAAVSVGRSGGENDARFELQDTNFLGTGKEVLAQRSSDVDRTSTRLGYRDPNILGSRARLEAIFSDNSDGTFQKLKIDRPFFSLETHWTAGGEYVEDNRIDSFYRLGKVSGDFRHRETFFEVRGGISRGLVDGYTRRWLQGFTYERDRFGVAGAPPPGVTLENRTLSYPWIAFQLIENRFLKTQDVNRIGRTEDLPIGQRFEVRLGWSSPLFGGDEELAIVSTRFSAGLEGQAGRLLLVDGFASGRLGRSGEQNALVGGNARFYWRNWDRHTFYAYLGFDMAENLDPERQLLLGGDTGLRGYPLRYQAGDRRALLTLEQRFFTRWHPFRLAYIGAAVFFDAGRVWSTGGDGQDELGTLSNLGLGLRISSSRSGFGSVLHMDLAFPLAGDPSIERVQFLVSTRESF